PLGGDPAVAPVPALRERFLLHRTAVTALRQPGLPGVQLDHLPASTCSQARQERDEHPRGTAPDRAPEVLLPRPVRDLFQVEGAPEREDPMSELPVAALARGREPAVHLAPLRLHLPLAFRNLPAVLALLHPTALVIVLRVVGPALPVKLALQTAQLPPVGGYLRAERLEECCLFGHHRDGARSQIQSHDALPQLMPR